MNLWNYRVIRQLIGSDDDQVVWLAVYEVHYTDGVPTLCSERPIELGGESLEELRVEMELFQKALQLPVLDMEIFEKKTS